MDNDIFPTLREYYPCDTDHEYFAGGHDWSDGTVYRCKYQGADRLVKVMPARSENAIAMVRERQAWMEHLNLHGVDTTLPLRSPKGNLAEAFNHNGKDYIAYCWLYVPGGHVQLGDPRRCRDFYQKWGRMLGKMHRLAKNWPDWLHSACLDKNGKPLISREAEWQVFFNWIQDAEVKAAWTTMRETLDTLPVNRANHGLIHNDAHPQNILRDGGRLVLIDFDVANFLWFALDLAICVYSEYSRVNFHSGFARRNDELDELFITPFMQAYESENRLPPEEYGRIELFLNYRRFLMFACFYDQIKSGAPDYLETMKHDIVQSKTYLPPDNYFNRHSN